MILSSQSQTIVPFKEVERFLICQCLSRFIPSWNAFLCPKIVLRWRPFQSLSIRRKVSDLVSDKGDEASRFLTHLVMSSEDNFFYPIRQYHFVVKVEVVENFLAGVFFLHGSTTTRSEPSLFLLIPYNFLLFFSFFPHHNFLFFDHALNCLQDCFLCSDHVGLASAVWERPFYSSFRVVALLVNQVNPVVVNCVSKAGAVVINLRYDGH